MAMTFGELLAVMKDTALESPEILDEPIIVTIEDDVEPESEIIETDTVDGVFGITIKDVFGE